MKIPSGSSVTCQALKGATKMIFQVFNMAADRGLGKMNDFSCFGKTLVINDFTEDI